MPPPPPNILTLQYLTSTDQRRGKTYQITQFTPSPQSNQWTPNPDKTKWRRSAHDPFPVVAIDPSSPSGVRPCGLRILSCLRSCRPRRPSRRYRASVGFAARTRPPSFSPNFALPSALFSGGLGSGRVGSGSPAGLDSGPTRTWLMIGQLKLIILIQPRSDQNRNLYFSSF